MRLTLEFGFGLDL
ncbi:unnamed protein product [Amaranthus hypochondriacus]